MSQSLVQIKHTGKTILKHFRISVSFTISSLVLFPAFSCIEVVPICK